MSFKNILLVGELGGIAQPGMCEVPSTDEQKSLSKSLWLCNWCLWTLANDTGLPSVRSLLAARGYPGVGVSLSQSKHSLFRGARATHACVYAAWLAEREGSSREVGPSGSDQGNQLPLKCPQRLERLRRTSLGLCLGGSVFEVSRRSLPYLWGTEGGPGSNEG